MRWVQSNIDKNYGSYVPRVLILVGLKKELSIADDFELGIPSHQLCKFVEFEGYGYRYRFNYVVYFNFEDETCKVVKSEFDNDKEYRVHNLQHFFNQLDHIKHLEYVYKFANKTKSKLTHLIHELRNFNYSICVSVSPKITFDPTAQLKLEF